MLPKEFHLLSLPDSLEIDSSPINYTHAQTHTQTQAQAAIYLSP